MQLTIYNGSPRGRRGNTNILLEKFIEGYTNDNNTYSINHLIKSDKMREFVGKFQNTENVILAFPLYTDSMPGIVMEFIEALQNVKIYSENPKIGYIIHCGFPESHHLRPIEKYLEKLTKRLGFHYLGTIVKAGSEGIRVSPPKLNKKLFNNFIALGKHFSEASEFDNNIITRIAPKDNFPKFIIPILKMLNKLGLFNIHWNKQLKKHNAFENRFDKPF